MHQLTARTEAPGEVTLIDPYEDDDASGRSGDQLAAVAAARLARRLVDGGDRHLGRRRPPAPALVRRAGAVPSRTGVSLYEQAFREADIPIEPAGRGMLAASREVQDVLALLRWLVFPDDDVALAAVLRSPIARLSEASFQRLLAARGLFRPGARRPPAAAGGPVADPARRSGAPTRTWR